jgi:DNA-binding MarR family transcriptional regulator
VTSPLDDLLCFATYSASRAITQAYREVLVPWNLTYTQFLVLVVLSEGDRSVSALGDELALDSGTLSPLLRRLEERGLVARTRDASDERVVVATLTVAGASTRRELSEAIECLVPALAGHDADVAGLIDRLHEVTARVREFTHQRRAPMAASPTTSHR